MVPVTPPIRRQPEAAALTARLPDRFRVFRFLADLFFDHPTTFRRKEGPQESVEQIAEEDYRRHPFVKLHRHREERDQEEEARDRARRPPVDRLETRVAELAEHHEGEEEHQRREGVLPASDRALSLVEPEHEQGDRRDHARRRRNRKAGKILVRIR